MAKKSFLHQLATRPLFVPIEDAAPSVGRARDLTVEPLEGRLMLHGSEPDYDLDDHVHAHLSIFVEGENIEIPAEVGITPAGIVANPHTHGGDGVFHTHAIGGAAALADFPTLGDFFAAWQTMSADQNRPDAEFSSTQLFDNFVDADHVIRMLVNNEPNDEFEDFA